jgi:hypothetical protein
MGLLVEQRVVYVLARAQVPMSGPGRGDGDGELPPEDIER